MNDRLTTGIRGATAGAGGGANPTSTNSTSRLLYTLNPDAVRERAKSIVGCKEVITYGESCISFMVGLHKPGQTDALARVNIFFDTGTVGTCRVLGGKMRQTFRRNVTSLDVVERLLKMPDKLTTIDESLIGHHDGDSKTTRGLGGLGGEGGIQQHHPSDEQIVPPKSPRSLKKELELADVGLCILQGEKEKLQNHMEYLIEVGGKYNKNKSTTTTTTTPKSHLNQQQHRGEINNDGYDDDDKSSSSSGSSLAGMEFRFSLPADVMAQVDQCLKDITRMDKLVKGVATNGKGTVFLYGNGGVAYTPSIPRALYQKLRQLRHSSYSARPCYISLGTRDRYYVAFHDGTADWKGPKALDKILKKCLQAGEQPRSVAFGSTYDTFFIVFSDGSWQYQGRGIPESLEEKLASRDDRADLVTVNLGPSGEWFLKAKNGRMWWSGITDDLDKVIGSILKANHFLHFLDFGENGSYFVSYDE